MDTLGNMAPVGTLGLAVTRNRDLGALTRRPSKLWQIKNWLLYRRREVPATIIYRLFGRLFSLVYIESCLRLVVRHGDGTITDYGIVSRRVVTTAGLDFLVDAFQGTTEPELFKYHGFGTGTNAEDVSDTALQMELTTQYASDNVRPTGTQTEGASANIYRTVGTLSPDSGGTLAITEHGIFSQAATGGGTLLDRSKFAAVNLVAGSDSLAATYEITLSAGG